MKTPFFSNHPPAGNDYLVHLVHLVRFVRFVRFVRSVHYVRFVRFVRIVCIACLPLHSFSQVHDNFSDGNFKENPSWTGDTAHFIVNAPGQLQLQSAGSDTSFLSTFCPQFTETEWSFWMKLSFNTSVNNNARVYLSADTSCLLKATDGIYLQAGGADDSISLVQQTGASAEVLYRFKSFKTAHSTNTMRFKILFSEPGFWTLMIDTTGGYNFFSEAVFAGSAAPESGWFGLVCRYTSSNATKFYFDDVYIGPVRHDTVPPVVVSENAETARVLQVVFSEPLQGEGTPENYRLLKNPGLVDSVAAVTGQPGTVRLFLQDSLPDGTLDSLRIRNIADLSGNRLHDTTVQVVYYIPKTYDILIHEIMADPDPPVNLPDAEFVELYNRSAFPLNLKGWTFRYGSYSKIFPAAVLPPDACLVISRDSVYPGVARHVTLFTSSASLSNEGTTLVLADPANHVIHAVSYEPGWYRGSFKQEGGWSLEMKDPANPCGCLENWGPSESPTGGTPGLQNSIAGDNPDHTAPLARRGFITETGALEVTFSEAMDSLTLLPPANWTLSGSGGDVQPHAVKPCAPSFSKVLLEFNAPFLQETTYRLKMTGAVKDCAGNVCDTLFPVWVGYPVPAGKNDVVINEILANPASGGARFVELYNRSEKILDLHTLALASGEEPDLPGAVPLAASGFLFFPGDYLALTSDANEVIARYRSAVPGRVENLDGFPVFGDDTGSVTIARINDLGMVDRMRYDPGMHYPLLASAEGVSLERTSPDLPSEDPANWHSASETSGFATPGHPNSHALPPGGDGGEIIVQPAIFTPDNDGLDDLATVTLNRADPDLAVNLTVYDAGGRHVRQLANNVLCGNETVFIWDGITETGNKAPVGFYILLVELTHAGGKTEVYKKVLVLGGKAGR